MIDELIEKVIDKRNPTVVGLDTRLEYVPNHVVERCTGGSPFEAASCAILEFNKAIIDAVYEYVPAVKIQIAYYEMYGPSGIEAFRLTAQYAKSKGLIVIGDVKRNDIGSTAEAYACAYLGETPLNGTKMPAFDLDFVTVNPYLGTDGVVPFIKACKDYNKGIFVLVKTSNPSSGEFQDLPVEGKRLYNKVAEKVVEWGRELIGAKGYSRVGAVIGATYPRQLEELRREMPNTYFLIPGYGAQGGSIQDVMSGFDEHGLGAVINASRSVICAYQRSPWKEKFPPERFADAARAEVLRMKEEIEAALSNKGVKPW
ncbi:orotidine-5'-phosphate decarboxylase [Caldicoprobacter guelmensis]|uniref:orotidine-5'-phosphate decarboxylase n=1 Tax=Caldicoprobacter guelmensis TaxID=1170224 RepID=UPI001956EDD8|nr:orotidine-5'-phosphate decarboxylase [Caldicoprobacter guelmensis]MBM7581986.1 orotidine-5'-phosphate decarboxylase [Caldicoprobacter guelmensis]